jgi:hypothetical protein
MLTLDGTITAPSPLAASAIKVAGAPLSSTIKGFGIGVVRGVEPPRTRMSITAIIAACSARSVTSTETFLAIHRSLLYRTLEMS